MARVSSGCCLLSFRLLFQGKFKVFLDNITSCRDPEPPLARKPALLYDYKIYNQNGHNYISGTSAVLREVSFINLGLKTYNVDSSSGRRQLQFAAEKLTCRSLGGQAVLVLTNINYTRSKCLLTKGNSTFKEIDVNKIAHRVPAWHAAGSLLNRLHLVDRGHTVFCYEVSTTVRDLD
ncbi:uncharacterized protein LOC125229367 [Leguminivora glycinivorella]|uniref:uncharacterized protein LOC125229367 n=1 Tax=Leguminivora glycinivorella TaxID=1035111 RepID=UPI00200BF0F9|nr:uncharacterized protein LOC125229367 [Leguminivora glycinivorella]